MAQPTREDRATGRHGRVLGSPLGHLTQSGVLTYMNKPAMAREQATQENKNGAHFSSGVRLDLFLPGRLKKPGILLILGGVLSKVPFLARFSKT